MRDNLGERLLEEYARKEQLYREFASLVKNILEVFLVSNGFKFQIFHRAKDENRLAVKIDQKRREGKEYKRLDDIEDLAGVRVVFYLESDKKDFLRSFLSEFEGCIVSHEEKYDPKGYRGAHIIFRLDKERSKLVEYRKYTGFKCEIQVSTILFHAWSEVEHDIIYKPQGEEKLLRTLGLDDLEESFQRLMVNHIQAATFQLDYLNKKYKAITKAGKILSSDFLVDIASSRSNDEIYQILEVIKDFYYRKPEETLAIVNAIVSKQALPPIVIHRFGDQEIHGRSHKDLVLKSIELLSNIRYFKPDEVLELVARLSHEVDKEISGKALEVVREFAKYDYNVLTKSRIGYGAQRKILDFMLGWSMEERIQHLDFIEVAAKELLNSTVEGSELTAEDTFTIHFGAVTPNNFLKKIRRETLDLIYGLYQTAAAPKMLLRLVHVLEEVTRTPSNVEYGDDLIEMIKEDLGYLIHIYRNMVFEDDGKIIKNLAVVEAVEQKLHWINKTDKFRTQNSEELRREILQDEFYQLFRLLVGDPITYREEEGWDTAEQKRAEEIDKLIDSIEEARLEEWSDKLNRIAAQHALVDDWQFNTFRFFLQKLTQVKPRLADKILNEAFASSLPLKYFAVSFLSGFRIGAQFELWDKYTDKITEAQDNQLISSVLLSLILPEGTNLEKSIREYDLDLVGNIVKRREPFSFLEGQDDRALHHALINVLSRNYKRDPERIEPLIGEEIKSNPGLLDVFFIELPLLTMRGWIHIQELQSATIEFLKEAMVELPNIDWHVQGLLLAIGRRDGLRAVLDVFLKRIQKDVKEKEKRRQLGDDRYESIPYHFNPDLRDFIAQHPEYKEIASEWVVGMTTDWSIYNWHVGEFLQRIGKGFEGILMVLIEKGDDDSLMKAARAMHSLEGVDFDLCIEIVRRTDNERILSQIAANMYATGVVSGEYGIAVAHEGKAKALEKYKDDESERVLKFTAQMIKSFQESARKERQRADEEREMRKIEFED
jgi:ppGpp synthetase/RelA/SpoT-type nucleotidyltranferase